jgi:bifunctional DNA-binding transcriptional regulator/antitoxin component of YhaV-PrlF toxin-antitoxin module
MSTLTVTAKGQITLKQELLQHLNVVPGQKVEAEMLPDGRIAIGPVRPKGSIDAFIGSLAKEDGPKLTLEEIKEITERAWAGDR